MKTQIAENVRTELARAQIPHTSLPDIIGMTRGNAAKRWSGETAYFAHEIALIAVVLNIPAGRLLDCAPRPTVADLAAGPTQ